MCATTGLVFWCGLFACFLLSLFVVEPAKRTKFKPFPLDQNHRIMSPRCSATAPSRPSTSRSGRRSRVAFRTSLCRHLRSKSNQRTHTHTHTMSCVAYLNHRKHNARILQYEFHPVVVTVAPRRTAHSERRGTLALVSSREST